MSDRSALTDLADFVGKSPLASENANVRRKALNGIRNNLLPQPAHRRVGDLLGIVLALSARTRRMMQPAVHIRLDVFSPRNGRAVRLDNGAE